MKIICKILLKIMGWKLDTNIPIGAERCVLLFAPHTSAWDFVVGKLSLIRLGLVSGFIIKQEAFWFPQGLILKLLGALPINRENSNKMPLFAASLFEKHKRLSLMIAPEGTRKRTDNWKRGFYFIANKANVPIALAYIDWKTKKCGIGKIIIPSGNFESDLLEIQKFYRGMQGKHKGCFNLE